MKRFKKECQHAAFERAHKFLYSEAERADGCWQCGGELVGQERPFYRSLGEIPEYAIEKELRKKAEEVSEVADKVLRQLNTLYYYCPPCTERRLKESMEGKTPTVPMKEVFARLRDKGRRQAHLLTRIQEVEECGPDCPYWDRLEGWKKEVEGE